MHVAQLISDAVEANVFGVLMMIMMI